MLQSDVPKCSPHWLLSLLSCPLESIQSYVYTHTYCTYIEREREEDREREAIGRVCQHYISYWRLYDIIKQWCSTMKQWDMCIVWLAFWLNMILSNHSKITGLVYGHRLLQSDLPNKTQGLQHELMFVLYFIVTSWDHTSRKCNQKESAWWIKSKAIMDQ